MQPVITKLSTLEHDIQFIDLKAQQQKIRPQVDEALKRVLDHGAYIMGPEVAAFEKEMATFCGVKHAISCSDGTDAIVLGLRVKEVGLGHAIFVPSFTFAATAEVVSWLGATPIFIDVLPDTYNMDPKSLEEGIKTARKLGLKATGIITVDLFGQPADHDTIQAIAEKHGVWIMVDAAQSFGATYKGKTVGNIGEIVTTSFFPAKPLGCYGDGGAIFTNDDEIAATIKSLRIHGSHPSNKYENIRVGMNARLDTMQAAILLEKIKIFPEEIKARQKIADFYNKGLQDLVQIPFVMKEATSVWAQYTVKLPKQVNRAELMRHLKEQGIPTMIYYVKPLHLQLAYKHYPVAGENGLPVSECLAEEVISLPMHPYLTDAELQKIVHSIREIFIKMGCLK